VYCKNVNGLTHKNINSLNYFVWLKENDEKKKIVDKLEYARSEWINSIWTIDKPVNDRIFKKEA